VFPLSRRARGLIAGGIATGLATIGLATFGLVQASAATDVEHITNGGFSAGPGSWYGYGGDGLSVSTGALCYTPAAGGEAYAAGVGLNGLSLMEGGQYTLSFDATGAPAQTIRTNVQLDAAPYSSALSATTDLAGGSHFSYTFTWSPSAANAGIAFQLGGAAVAWTFCVDNVSLLGPPLAAEQIVNGTFDTTAAPWWSTGNLTPSVATGMACTPVPAGGDPWNAIIGQDDIALLAGESYTFSFRASASAPVVVRALIQHPTTFATQVDEHPSLSADAQTFSYTFTSTVDLPNAQVAFQIGGAAGAWTFCLDDVSLTGGAAPPVYTPDTGPRVRVNQVAYLPSGPKNATLVTDATTAMPWQLTSSSGAVVASGQTTPRGVDPTSGQNVHSIDFGGYTASGTGFTLVADGETSHPFDISGDAYAALRLDALKFYYTQRSGIAIDDSLRPGYGRPAGHVGVAPNQGDTLVPCQPGVCDYSLNVQGGWYDAGDHGKYVVNGGIAVYQLLSEFERTKVARSSTPNALGDNTLALPESGNGVPDVLDEARWELEFLLSMQVPAGKPLAGMVHHKVHDANWTGLPLLPDADPQPRELHPPSTAATLNLAAVAAQAARLFAPYDSAFAARARAAAITAYAAAVAHPAVYALASDGTGGGTYDDDNVTDEFYWAAAELYLTTGEQAYADAIVANPWHTADVFRPEGFDWRFTATAGRLDLALLPNNLPGRDAVRASVLAGADKYLAAQAANPYGIDYAPTSGQFEWGSNNLVLNNMVVMATAFDLSAGRRYRDGVLQGMDYLLGRNALNQSYVTGYGEQASQNQHTRWYAHQLNPALPHPPAGSLAGGPNSGIQDPKAQSLLQGCQPQFCYVDDINSYSTNEIAINWNSTLAWVSSFVADQAVPPATAACQVRFIKNGDWPGHFIGQVIMTNTGPAPINGWTLQWAYLGDQKMESYWSATITSSGAGVTAKNLSWNATIQSGQTVTFGFIATTTGPNPTPALFRLNGAPCG
jgi:endoglucanase